MTYAPLWDTLDLDTNKIKGWESPQLTVLMTFLKLMLPLVILGTLK